MLRRLIAKSRENAIIVEIKLCKRTASNARAELAESSFVKSA
jgi:hypothetical protein